MCLGQLAECVSVAGDGTAVVRVGAVEQVVSLLTMQDAVALGDWLVVHSGFALERISAAEAAEAMSIRETTDQEEST